MPDNHSAASVRQASIAIHAFKFVASCARACTLTAATAVIALALACGGAGATTKGLNQIVTADIQPEGQLSLSYQLQDPNIGNREELQAELGITSRFEIAAFQGFAPSDQILNMEYGLIQQPNWLLSTGFLDWSTKGDQLQPFLVGAHIMGPFTGTLGVISVPVPTADPTTHTTQVIMGLAYRADPRTQYQVDYQTGSGNSATAGVTYNLTPSLTFNPAIYVSNDPGHKCYGYGVLSYTITAFK